MAAKHKLILTGLPAPGHKHIDGGQEYVVVASRAHTNRAGEASGVITWRSACREPGCGAEIRQETGFKIRGFNRKCSAHSLWAGKARIVPPNTTGGGIMTDRPAGDLVTADGRVVRLEAGWRFTPSYGAAPHPASPIVEDDDDEEYVPPKRGPFRFTCPGKLIDYEGAPALDVEVRELCAGSPPPRRCVWRPGVQQDPPELLAMLETEWARLQSEAVL